VSGAAGGAVGGHVPAADRLRGVRLLATAATRGIGFAVAAQAAREGARVVVTGPDATRAAAAAAALRAEGGDVLGLQLDVADAASIVAGVAAARERLGGIDALFLNVPGARPGALDALDEAAWQEAFTLYVLSVLRTMSAARVDLEAAAPGRVVLITSYAAMEPIDGLTLSNVVRPAVHALVREMARAYGPRGILVNAVAPGRVDTERVREVEAAAAPAGDAARTGAVRAAFERAIPLGRYAAAGEVARVAAFLLSRENTYVTGQALLVDGALVRGL
jgi:3-oxoacyl-[acyl-carrier protein] reductase